VTCPGGCTVRVNGVCMYCGDVAPDFSRRPSCTPFVFALTLADGEADEQSVKDFDARYLRDLHIAPLE
jgi:hypothetical protein